MKKKQIAARLILEDGTEFPGYAFGKTRSQAGEVVFSTGMTGYNQSLTDPSFRGQILVFTYPLIGNYGVPVDPKSGAVPLAENGLPLGFESEKVQVGGIIVSELCEEPGHHASQLKLSDWLEKQNVPGIYGIDTRALTERLREHGVMRGKIHIEGSREVRIDSGDLAHPVADVSPSTIQEYPAQFNRTNGRAPRVVLVDCGAKANIMRCLLARGFEVVRVPWNQDLSGIEADGYFLSNGPGDPKACGKTIASVRRLIQGKKPVFGICLGNQILALAAGADTYKLPYGHRGANQPCIDLDTQRCYITSQNHGYAVRQETLPKGFKVWFVNGNDDTVEGIKSENGLFRAVQFHPEGCPGPRDTEYLLDNFAAQVRECAGLSEPEALTLPAGISLDEYVASLDQGASA